MAFVICEPCVGVKDASCTTVCPSDAIHPLPSDPNFALVDQLFIDPASCVNCGLCVAICPVSAIYPEAQVPPQWQSYIAKNADYYSE